MTNLVLEARLDQLAEAHLRAKREYDIAVSEYQNSNHDCSEERLHNAYKDIQRKLVNVEARLRLLKAHSEIMINEAVEKYGKEDTPSLIFNGEYDG